jgi:hypothetical protein
MTKYRFLIEIVLENNLLNFNQPLDVIIQGGELIFDDNQNVTFKAECIVISDSGKLQVGTEEKPFQH